MVYKTDLAELEIYVSVDYHAYKVTVLFLNFHTSLKFNLLLQFFPHNFHNPCSISVSILFGNGEEGSGDNPSPVQPSCIVRCIK